MEKRLAYRTFRMTIMSLAVFLAVAVVAALQPARAFAEGEADLARMGNDYLWAGQVLSLDGTTVENDLLAAGQVLEVENSTVGGSVRVAGQTIKLTNVTAQQSVTAAGETVTITDSQANAVAMAGRTASFSGSCTSLAMYASEVIIDGVVEGDVTVGANKVTVGEHARVTGTLHVSAPQEPVIQNGAEVAGVDFTQEDEDGFTSEQMSVALSGLVGAIATMLAIVGVIGTLVTAVVAEWLFSRHTAAAAELVRTRIGATIGSGIVGALAAPLAVVLLCVLVVTLPVALCLILALLAMATVASGFASASLAKVAFPKLGRYAGTLALAAIVGVAKALPILGGIVRLAAFMFFLGYVLQSIYLGLRKDGHASPVPVDVTQ